MTNRGFLPMVLKQNANRYIGRAQTHYGEKSKHEQIKTQNYDCFFNKRGIGNVHWVPKGQTTNNIITSRFWLPFMNKWRDKDLICEGQVLNASSRQYASQFLLVCKGVLCKIHYYHRVRPSTVFAWPDSLWFYFIFQGWIRT